MAGVRDIPDLLHDATLESVAFDAAGRTVSLAFECLRRGVDGEELLDRVVELRLEEVNAVAVFELPGDVEQRPSELPPLRKLSALSDWLPSPREAFLFIDADDPRRFYLRASPRTQVLFGMPSSKGHVSQIVLAGAYGQGSIEHTLYVEHERFAAFSNQCPFSLDAWEAEYRSWWGGWREHWELDEDANDNADAARDPSSPSPRYVPPARPAVARDIEAPPFFAPIRERHEHALLGNDDDGKWVYIQSIDGWWQEGALATVVVRGIEHTAPDEEGHHEAELETVISYSLIADGDKWFIRSSSQGWPKYGSAPADPRKLP